MKNSTFGYVLLFLMSAAIIYSASLHKELLTPAEVWPLALGALSGAVLWGWMLLNFFANRKKIKNPVLWGLSLFIFNWIAAIIYFFGVYTSKADAARDRRAIR